MENPKTTTPDVADFLSTVQPAGIHYLAYADGGLKHKVYREASEAVELAGLSYVSKCDTYFALASFLREKKPVEGKAFEMCDRTQSNVALLRSIWLDVDYKAYGSRQACLQAVVSFLRDSPLPAPSYMVSSGGGFHIYWAVDEDLEQPRWMVIARGLRELTKAKGLQADYQVTVDAARILRLPGTTNWKEPTNPRPCEIIGGKGAQYPYEQLVQALEGYTVQQGGTVLGTLQVDSNVVNLFGGTSNARDLTNHQPFYMAHVATGCGVVADSLARAGEGDAYPLWKNLLHLASFADDGRDYVHRLSHKGTGYSPEEAMARFEESISAAASDPAMGPTLCDTFAGMSPKCSTCPLRGKQKSPAAIKVVEAEDGQIEAAKPDHLDPSFTEKGFTYRLDREEDGENGTKFVRKVVVDKEVSDFAYGEDNGQPVLQFNYKNGTFVSPVEVRASELMEGSTFRSTMAKAAAVFDLQYEKSLQKVLMSWLTKLQNTQLRRPQPSFGWVYDHDKIQGFAHNGTVYRTDGSTAVSGSVDPIMKETYAKTGDVTVWRELATTVERDARAAIHMMVATTFASPLMSIGSDARAFTLAFYSRGSGVGKSAHQRFAQAVWGHPTKASSSLDDTAASVAHKLGKTTGLPGYWDELSKNRVPEFVQLMFQATQGKTRQRLDQSARMRETHQMAGMMVVNTNDPIMDDVLRYRDGTAGLFRFFQVRVPPRSESRDNFDPQFELKVSKLDTNFGHMGETYARFLVTNLSLVEETMEKVRELVIQKLGQFENERFWRQALVSLLSGVILARKAGIINLDGNKILQAYEELVLDGRAKCGVVDSQTLDVASEILHDYQQNLLVVRDFKGKGGSGQVDVLRAPMQNQSVKLQLVVQQGKLVIPHVVIKDFCDRRGKSESHVLTVLVDQMGATKRKLTMGAGTMYAEAQGRLWCYELDWKSVLSQSEIDTWTDRIIAGGEETTT